MEQLMDISHVSYSYHTMQGETPALSNINFTVHKGDFLAVVGPSGCGNGMVLQGKQITWQPLISADSCFINETGIEKKVGCDFPMDAL